MFSFTRWITRLLSTGISSASDKPQPLLDPNFNVTASTFFVILVQLILNAPNPAAAINRFSVKTITFLQGINAASQHEFLCVEVSDEDSNNQNSFPIFIERTVSHPYEANLESFSQHPDSKVVSQSIISGLKGSFPSHPQSSAPSSSPDMTPDSSWSQTHSLVDAAPFTQPVGDVKPSANDRVMGCGHMRIGSVLTVRQITPSGFNLFELALIADIVHHQNPLHSLLRKQSYWYSNLICDTVRSIYFCDDKDIQAPLASDEICIPPNDYLPEMTGHWCDILISDLQATLVSLIQSNFQTLKAKHIATVGHMWIWKYCILIFNRFTRNMRLLRKQRIWNANYDMRYKNRGSWKRKYAMSMNASSLSNWGMNHICITQFKCSDNSRWRMNPSLSIYICPHLLGFFCICYRSPVLSSASIL